MTSGQAEELQRKKQLFVALSTIGIGTLLGIGAVSLLRGNGLLAVADFPCAVVLAGNLLLGLRNSHLRSHVMLGTATAAALYVFVFVTGGAGNSGFVWYYTFPLLASFMLGARAGFSASVLLLLPVVVLFCFDPPVSSLAQYAADFKFRLVPSYLVVCLFSYFAKANGKTVRESLYAIREELEARVRERTQELVTTNDALAEEVLERRRIEEDLRETRDYLQSIVDGVPEGLMVINPDHSVALSNRAMGGFGGRLQEMEGKPTCFHVSHRGDAPCRGNEHPCPLKEVIRSRRRVAVEHAHRDEKGEERIVEIVAVPRQSRSGCRVLRTLGRNRTGRVGGLSRSGGYRQRHGGRVVAADF